MMGPCPLGIFLLGSGSFSLAVEYVRPTLPFLVINTCSVESEVLIAFFFFAMPLKKPTVSIVMHCLFKSYLYMVPPTCSLRGT